jgi:hypothetical protein
VAIQSRIPNPKSHPSKVRRPAGSC